MAGGIGVTAASSISTLACAAGSCNSAVNSTALLTRQASGPDFSATGNALATSMGSFGVSTDVSGNDYDGQVIANSTASATDRLFFSGITAETLN
jgi:hypothetical protein